MFMHSHRRRLAALIIIVFGAGFSLFNIFNASPPKSTRFFEAKTAKELSANLNFKLATPEKARLTEAKGNSIEFDNGNLTDRLSESYTAEIIKRNLDGGTPKDGSSPLNFPGGKTFEEIIFGQFSKDIDFERFERKDIRISKDTSKETEVVYLESLDKLLRRYASVLGGKDILAATQDFIGKKDPTLLNRMIENIPPLINGLLALSAPVNLAETHLEYLNLWQKKLAYYTAIVNANEDPLKAAIALQKIAEIGQTDADLQLVLIKRYEEIQS